MEIERLRKIIKFNKAHYEDMQSILKNFCHRLKIDNFDDVRDILQIIRNELSKENWLAIQLPLKDNEIGGFIYRGDAFSYLVFNSSLPVVTSNFAFCHELYHAFFPAKEDNRVMQVEFFNTDDDSMGNLFAANILMPENEFIKMFNRFRKEDDKLATIISLMNYFKAPFMAVFIRCYELELFKDNNINPEYLNLKQSDIENKFEELWFNTEMLKPSNIDDSANLLKFVTEKGNEYITRQYINKRTLNVILKNLDSLLTQVRAGN